jgi:hypothetical protein
MCISYEISKIEIHEKKKLFRRETAPTEPVAD